MLKVSLNIKRCIAHYIHHDNQIIILSILLKMQLMSTVYITIYNTDHITSNFLNAVFHKF